MARKPAKAHPQATGTSAAPGRGAHFAMVGLALGWIIAPMVQYVAADQRMRLITTGSAPLEGIALLDLTVPYLALVVLTIAYVAVHAMRKREVSSKA